MISKTRCVRCDPWTHEEVVSRLLVPAIDEIAVFCEACLKHMRADEPPATQKEKDERMSRRTNCVNCEGWGCNRCVSVPKQDEMIRDRPARIAAAERLVEALIDADDAAEASPFSVLVLPEAVKVELERCRVAFKRARRD